MDMPRYHTVLFDADNTLFDFTRSEREAIGNTLRFFDIAPSEDRISLYSKINEGVWKRLERGEITKAALRTTRFREFGEALGIPLDAIRAADVYQDFLSESVHLLPSALEVCRALSEAYELFIVTNGIKEVQRKRFSASLIKPYFNDVFISDEIGFEKPHKAFFDAVAERIEGFSADTTLIVGDSLTSDIKGGIAAGIDTCWLDQAGKGNEGDIPCTYRIGALEELLPLLLT